MLRLIFIRKAARLRRSRVGCGSVHFDQSVGYHSTHLETEMPIAQKFPLYSPPPPPKYVPLTAKTLAALPSDEALSRQLKKKVTRKAVENLLDYTEEDLRDFYVQLVKTGPTGGGTGLVLEAPNQRKLLSDVERQDILNELAHRLSGGPSVPFLPAPRRDRDMVQQTPGQGVVDVVDVPYQLLDRLASFAAFSQSGPSETSKGKGLSSEASASHGVVVALGLVRSVEWDALFQEFIRRGDVDTAESLLDVVNAHGVPVQVEWITDIMRVHALRGRPDQVSRLMEEVASSEGVEPIHQDNFILSILRQTPSDPRPAIAHLRQAERIGQPFPQSSYQVVIEHLTIPSALVQPNSHTRAMAWDLFAHMRLIAHPTPTQTLYATMIRACGEARQPQPERARDLWIEMTVQEKLEPRSAEYNAIIKALGSTKKDYLEAFDLLRQLLVKHHDAIFVPFEEEEGVPKSSEYLPTLETFISVMEGTKRAGDVNRARWVLTEVVKLSRAGQALNIPNWTRGANEGLMSAVFMTYAAWVPVLARREMKLQKDDKVLKQDSKSPNKETVTAEFERKDAGSDEAYLNIDVLEDIDSSATSATDITTEGSFVDENLAPITAADALRESTRLFERILFDVASSFQSKKDFLPFQHVDLIPRLINSYISVHLAHGSSLAAVKQTFDRAWEDASAASRRQIRPNAWTYILLLEKCASGTRGGLTANDRSLALAWGRQLWQEYLSYYKDATAEISQMPPDQILATERKRWLHGIGDRQIERAWKAAIKLEAVRGSSSAAMDMLEEFYRQHPPDSIMETYKPLPELGFQVKMFTPASTPEADVPPLFTFDDLKPLHQRLATEGKIAEIGKLKWIVSKYQGSLRKRRKWRLEGLGQGDERKKMKQWENSIMSAREQDEEQIEEIE
ncbi:uncharacterized protein L203_104953 [Cryptococcus depauperatus CBS 7841]|uniref:Uncharacterized protein n=1 Tax=Cryptococcus depauperatus CBS 7841 TaxID=1295531 RepID=A0A1E3IPQ6_9TREE|nr:hypothetical protein L203_01833 [Cryptococcus depauperatus CBS 7841]